MDYIIVWRSRHRDPLVDTDTHGFLETYATYELAKAEAERVLKAENEGSKSQWYFDYAIFERSNG